MGGRWIAAAAAGLVAAAAAAAAPAAGPEQVSGKAVFEGKGNCFTCHGKAGQGTPIGPDLTDGEWLHVDGTVAQIRELIERGVAKPKRYPAPMPAMGGARLSAEELDAVAAYVASLAGQEKEGG